jgi:hypothetical protein
MIWAISDEDLRQLQNMLLKNPLIGDIDIMLSKKQTG